MRAIGEAFGQWGLFGVRSEEERHIGIPGPPAIGNGRREAIAVSLPFWCRPPPFFFPAQTQERKCKDILPVGGLAVALTQMVPGSPTSNCPISVPASPPVPPKKQRLVGSCSPPPSQRSHSAMRSVYWAVRFVLCWPGSIIGRVIAKWLLSMTINGESHCYDMFD